MRQRTGHEARFHPAIPSLSHKIKYENYVMKITKPQSNKNVEIIYMKVVKPQHILRNMKII